jgi:hypothetical protein
VGARGHRVQAACGQVVQARCQRVSPKNAEKCVRLQVAGPLLAVARPARLAL